MRQNWCRLISILLLTCTVCFSNMAWGADPIRIGFSLGLSGTYKPMSEQQKRAYELWRDHINAKGGILGRPVELVLYDDRSNKEQAIKVYERLLEQDKIDFLFGPYSSGLTGAVAPIAEKHNIPMLASGATSDGLWKRGYKNLFGMLSTASRYSVGVLELAALNDAKRLGVIAADDAFSRSVAEGTKQWASDFGINIAADITFPKGTSDLTEQVQIMKDKDVDVVVVGGHFNESVDVRQAMERVGLKPMAYFATVGPALVRYGASMESLAEGTFTSIQWHESIAFQPGDRELFTDAFLAKYKIAPSYHAATAYAAGQTLETAITRSGSTDPNKVRDMLYTMDTVNIMGRFGVDKTGMQIRHFPLLGQWQNGTLKIVWPETLAKTQPILRIN